MMASSQTIFDSFPHSILDWYYIFGYFTNSLRISWILILIPSLRGHRLLVNFASVRNLHSTTRLLACVYRCFELPPTRTENSNCFPASNRSWSWKIKARNKSAIQVDLRFKFIIIGLLYFSRSREWIWLIESGGKEENPESIFLPCLECSLLLFLRSRFRHCLWVLIPFLYIILSPYSSHVTNKKKIEKCHTKSISLPRRWRLSSYTSKNVNSIFFSPVKS